MAHCGMLITNEGGSIHVTKAFDKLTFMVYPLLIRGAMGISFEDGLEFDRIHLKDVTPEIY
ncbi:MAG: hypothetical protein ABI045_01455 [Flavobacteriales bacterium]